MSLTKRPLLLGLLALAPAVQALPQPFQTDFGGTGLLQTPSARMAEVGNLSIGYSNVSPYSRTSINLQPFGWAQFGFRYTSIHNRQYLASSTDRANLDKGVDLKLRLWQESRYLPEVALGWRDLGGTGLFSSEYLVGNKRWYNLDLSLGFATGYIGAGGSLDNPLGALDDHFKQRRLHAGGSDGGEPSLKQWFTGKVGAFGGIAWQTPWQPLTLMLEYDANDYQHEPQDNFQPQSSHLNVGARLRPFRNLVLSAGYERGNTLMLGVTLSLNVRHIDQLKLDAPPVLPQQTPPAALPADWHATVTQLKQNAGVDVRLLQQQGDQLVVTASATKFRSLPETELRANRILHNQVPSDITRFRYRWEKDGLLLREDSLPRAPLPENPLIVPNGSALADQDLRRQVSVTDPAIDSDAGKTLFQAPAHKFDYGFSTGLKQNYGGPDGYLYAILLRANASAWTDAHGWLSGSLSYNLTDNFDNITFMGHSDLPRVRTYIADYLKHSTLTLSNLQYTRTARLSQNWFAMGYVGMLEMMFGGVGGELLYRPFNSPFAVGLDSNWVKQRDFDVHFGFRDYETVTGHLTGYWDTGLKGILVKASAGRYLAKDWGGTLDLSRRFDSGARFGIYATFTNAGKDFGEGGFDKGIYVSIPWDAFFLHASRGDASIAWEPLTRDGGAKLYRRYQLYDITSDRNMGRYWQEFEE